MLQSTKRQVQFLILLAGGIAGAFRNIEAQPSISSKVLLAQSKLPLLTRVADIRQLSPRQAALGYPVRVEGVVTYCDQEWSHLFVQDETAGIYVEWSEPRQSLPPGMRVEVRGISGRGGFLPIISQATVQPLQMGKLPEPRRIRLSGLNSLRDDCQWSEIEGAVRTAVAESQFAVLQVAVGTQKIKVRIRNFPYASSAELVDSRVRIQGVVGTVSNSAGQPVSSELWVPEGSWLSLLKPASPDPRSLPVTSISDLAQKWTVKPPEHRVHIKGILESQIGPGIWRVKDQTGAMIVEAVSNSRLEPGNQFDVVGFAKLNSRTPALEEGVLLRTESKATSSLQEKGLPLLTKVEQIRRLDKDQARRGFPVRIRGILTFFDPSWRTLFIQDETDGIFVDLGNQLFYPKSAERYELEGFSGPGDFAPIIVKPRFVPLGRGPLPPPQRVTLAQLGTGRYDSWRVEVEGIVRMVTRDPSHALLTIVEEGRRLLLSIPRFETQSPPFSLVDARVRVRGICAIQVNPLGVIEGFQLYPNSLSDIDVIRAARPDPFAEPLQPIRDVLRFSTPEEQGHRVRIEGTVLHQQPGKTLYLRDRTGSILIGTQQTLPVHPGDAITAVGYPVPGPLSTYFEDAIFKRLGPGELPLPTQVSAREVLTQNHHGNLIQLRAHLLQSSGSPEGQTLVLQDAQDRQIIFEALLEGNPYQHDSLLVESGSLLELTGICLVRVENQQVSSFRLLLRGTNDLRLLSSPPWWNLQRTLWAIVLLITVVLAGAVWGVFLKRQMNRQAQILRLQLESEAALEKKYRELFESSHDLVFSSDLNAKFASINQAGERLTGYSRDELLALPPEVLFPEEHLPAYRQWIQQKLAGGESSTFQCELLAKDGRRVPLEFSAGLVYEAGKPVGLQGIARDISERKEAERMLRASEERLRHAQQLEAIGTLAGGIAHDFNNILAAILGYAELTSDDIPPGHPARGNLEQILKAGTRARDLVQQILAFSRRLEQDRQPVQWQPILKEALKLLRATLPSTIEIRFHIDPDGGYVMADPAQLHQVFMNLATNAYQALRKQGGTLEVRLSSPTFTDEEAKSVPGLKAGHYALLSVRDTGLGMSSEVLKRIYDPYFTTKPVGEGSGLGLAVVHGIVQGYGGAIAVDSTPGEGSLFRIYLPCLESKAGKEAKDAFVPAHGHGRIMFVDDEGSIAELYRKILERLGYQVTTCQNGQAALETYWQDPSSFDLIITDQTMPQMTGVKLAQEIWTISPQMPIIICTGFSEELTIAKAVEMGFSTLLTKPVTTSELSRAVQKAMLAESRTA